MPTLSDNNPITADGTYTHAIKEGGTWAIAVANTSSADFGSGNVTVKLGEKTLTDFDAITAAEVKNADLSRGETLSVVVAGSTTPSIPVSITKV